MSISTLPARKSAHAICLLALLIWTAACQKSPVEPVATAPDSPAGMTQHTYTASGGTISYWLYTPANATADMPLIVYLHGGSGRGTDLSLVVSGSLPQFLQNGSVKDVPAYILMPQCPTNRIWDAIGSTVKELIDKVAAEKKSNSRKISLTGHSLGGTGTWNLGATYAAFFSCIAPLSGSVNSVNAPNYTSIPVWAFVGSADAIVDPASSQAVVPLINGAGGNAQLKVYPGATHFDVPDLVYKDQSVKVLDWLISQTRR